MKKTQLNCICNQVAVLVTVTESVARFNKATAADLGYPAYVKILINDKTRQIAVQACNAKSANAVKFSKPEGKQTASVNIKEAVVLEALHKYFELPQASEGEVASVAGTIHVEEKVIIFDIDAATSGTMKKRGRKKNA